MFGFYLLRLSNFIPVSILLGSSASEEAKPALKPGQPEPRTLVLL